MIRVFQFLISGCWHEWEEVHGTIYYGALHQGSATVCRCVKCKSRKVVWGNPKEACQ